MAITRLWQCGFETRSGDEYTGGYTEILSGARSGTYANKVSVSTGVAGDRYFYQDISGTKQIRTGFALYIVTDPGSVDGQYCVLRSAGANLVEIKLEADSDDLQLMVAGVQKDITTNSPIVITTWTHLSIDCKIDGSAGWVYVYLNGVEVLSFDGNTGTDDIESVRYGSPDTQFTGAGANFFDDCYIDDTTGEGVAAVCPLLKFEWITPNATGNYDQWVGSDGNNVNNYALVDEIPPSTADYVEEDTVDEFDSYAMTTYALGAGEQIDAVIPIVYAQRYGATERLALGTRYSGADVIGSDQDPGFGAWSMVSERQTAKPGGGAWTQAALDAVEAVIKSRGSF